MATYLGNSNTKEVHNLDKEKPKCNIALIESGHRVEFVSLDAARRAGYDPCDHCIGGSTR
jgi:hypothetical protein